MNLGERPFLERLPLAPRHIWLGYLAAALLSALALWIRWALDPAFPPGFPYLTFFPAVVVSSFLFGRGPGIFAAIICGLLAWYFFIPPFSSFTLGRGTSIALAFYIGVVAVDLLLIDWMQKGNVRLRAERERSRELADHTKLLFNELQHRVSNNLQMVGAVLSLQRRTVEDVVARQALTDAAAKLQTIGRIQRQLYDTSGAPLTLDRFLPDLTRDLIDASGRPDIVWHVDAEPGIQLPADAAIPVALIMAEAIANAVEHGFAERENGKLDIHVTRDGAILELSVTDDGAGPPPGFDAATATSLGLRIARTLAAQLGGSFSLSPAITGGAVSRLQMPLRA
ncbi:sensor histidine kinase [Sphingomonas sp. LT1P40]|uniref:sensor histidine kinase n=1 Tax=Alteristakelama amylovorans TaxID=3096166 RepID=UPI002FCAA8F2